VATATTSVIDQMASNLQNSTQKFPGGCPMGRCVEDIAGRNLARNAQSYDYFDEENRIAGQIQGTRSVATPDALMKTIKAGVGKLTDAPEVVSTNFEGGGKAVIVKSELNQRFLIQAIPSTPVNWNFEIFMQQIEQLEQSSDVIIKIVPTDALNQ
jgi:hypothetical protein